MRFFFLIFLFGFFPAAFVQGQEDSFSTGAENADTLHSVKESNAGLNENFIIREINFQGNKTTRSNIMMRELLFKQGDTVAVKDLERLLEKTHNNLINTSLFNFVTIDTVLISGNIIDVEISVIERWYTWPFPFFEVADRNFNVWWKDKDWSKINYGVNIVQENFRGRRESLRLMIMGGLDRFYGLSYMAPYVNRKKTIGVGLTVGCLQKHTVAFDALENRLRYVNDPEEYIRQEYLASIGFLVRRGIYISHLVEFSYQTYVFNDTILKLNPLYSPGGLLKPSYFSVSYTFKDDHRDVKAYPLKGFYFDIILEKKGLGLLAGEKTDLLMLQPSFRQYFSLGKHWYYAWGMTAMTSDKSNVPWFFQHALGYERDFVRGYEYYVIDGQHFGLFKHNLKYELLSPRVKTIKFIPTEKFNKIHYAMYLNIFNDLGYVWDKQYGTYNLLADKLIYSAGLGLDFVTYYDKVLRVEYAINHLGERGLFFSFIAPI